MSVYKCHAFIFLDQPPPWPSRTCTTGMWGSRCKVKLKIVCTQGFLVIKKTVHKKFRKFWWQKCMDPRQTFMYQQLFRVRFFNFRTMTILASLCQTIDDLLLRFSYLRTTKSLWLRFLFQKNDDFLGECTISASIVQQVVARETAFDYWKILEKASRGSLRTRVSWSSLRHENPTVFTYSLRMNSKPLVWSSYGKLYLTNINLSSWAGLYIWIFFLFGALFWNSY